jgi:hypothetical protein
MSVSPIRRPTYSRRSVLQWVNNAARSIATDNDGRIADVFLLDAKLRAALDNNPELLDKDKYVRDCRKFWERSNHVVLTQHPSGLVQYVPGAFITLGGRV